MRRTRWIASFALALGLALAVASCGDTAPTGVTPNTPAPQASLIGDLLEHTGLLTCSPLPYDSTSRWIGPAGGSISVGPHTLYIPAGALERTVKITAVVPSDTINAVRFQPHGLRFDRPAYLTMSYANCNLLGSLVPKRIAYTTNLGDILQYLLSWDNFWSKKVTGRVRHFSQYAVSW